MPTVFILIASAVVAVAGESLPVLVSGKDVQAPERLQWRAPDYPEIGRQARIQGIVVLAVTTDEEGRPAEIKVLRGIPILDEAAVAAVKKARYAPTVVDGVARRVKFLEEIPFVLYDGETLRMTRRTLEDQNAPAAARLSAVRTLMGFPSRYRKEVRESLSRAASDPDAAVAEAAKAALAQVGGKEK